MKLFFIIFGAIVAAGVVLMGIVAVPYVLEKKQELSSDLLALKKQNMKLAGLAYKEQAELLNQLARSSPSKVQQKEILASLDELKLSYAKDAQKAGSDDFQMQYAGQLIRQIDDWTREWRN
ncbi:MAG: hypothetical protein EB121_00420 [Alphaproteobacteria bacterium]|nr:hypothetical protein [Alphaproteobacteria bacterium]